MIAPRTRRGDGRLTAALDPQDQGPQDECGVFGVWAPGEEVAKLAYYGLYALQHRGQESAGIAVSDGGRIAVYKDIGLVSQVFDEATLTALSGHIAVGHCRYSTTGVNKWANAQPTLGATADDGTALFTAQAVFIAVSIEHFAQHGPPGAVQDLLDRLTSALDHDGPDRPSPHPPDR